MRRRRATRVPRRDTSLPGPKYLLACCAPAKSRVLLLPDERDCTMNAAACCPRSRISNAGALCPAHPLLTTRPISTLAGTRGILLNTRHLQHVRARLSQYFKLPPYQIKLKSTSNQHQTQIPNSDNSPHPTHEEGGGSGEDAVMWPMRPRAPPPLWGPTRASQRWSPRCRPDAERGSRAGCPWEERSLWPLARPGRHLRSPSTGPKEECGGSYRSDSRGVPHIPREGLLVGRGWGRQEIGCMHGLSCSVPCDHDDDDDER